MKKVIKIGVVGFSSNQFDQLNAREILRNLFKGISEKHQEKTVEIVSGYTNSGVPKIAYELAAEFDFATVGFSAQQALRVRSGVYPVDKKIIVGKYFGEESEAFTSYIDGLIRIGGGPQSRKEVQLFKSKNQDLPLDSILVEKEVNWLGTQARIYLDAIPGLELIEDFLNPKEQASCLTQIDQHLWSSELKRRVQHYGFKYDYRKRKINEQMRVDPLPDWTSLVTDKLLKQKVISYVPDQLIVNEYLAGQGIANHIDCEPCFGDTILSLSLGADVIMDLTHKSNGHHEELHLKAGSLLVLKGDSRYNWMHGIVGRKSDLIKGVRKARKRRVSMTFRKVILTN